MAFVYVKVCILFSSFVLFFLKTVLLGKELQAVRVLPEACGEYHIFWVVLQSHLGEAGTGLRPSRKKRCESETHVHTSLSLGFSIYRTGTLLRFTSDAYITSEI